MEQNGNGSEEKRRYGERKGSRLVGELANASHVVLCSSVLAIYNGTGGAHNQ